MDFDQPVQIYETKTINNKYLFYSKDKFFSKTSIEFLYQLMTFQPGDPVEKKYTLHFFEFLF